VFDDLFRRYKDLALAPLTRLVHRVSPNTLTVMAFVSGVACAGAAANGLGLWVLGLWLLNRVLDGLDGAVARHSGQQSDFGGYLDIVLDFAVYAAVPLGLALHQPTTVNLIALAALLASFYINGASWMYLSAIMEKRAQGASARGEPTTVTMPDGLIGGVATFFFYCAFCVWPGSIAQLFWLMAGLVLFTAGQRLGWAWRNLSLADSATRSPAQVRKRAGAHQVIVIGAGAAGLATAYHLQRRGIDYVLLERERVGHAWQRHYDSLTLNTPRAVSALPGLPMPRDYPRFPTAAQMHAYLRAYADCFGLNIEEGVSVHAARHNGRWTLHTNQGPYHAETVIVATGIWSTPHCPRLPGVESFRGDGLHSSEYRNPEHFRGQRVLVVGAGNSGAEMAVELGEAGVEVAISVRGGVTFAPEPRSALAMRFGAWFYRAAPRRLAERLLRRSHFAGLGLPAPTGSLLDAYPVAGFDLPNAVRAGKVKVYGAIETLTANGARFDDGREAAFDVLLLATGYRPTVDFIAHELELNAEGWPKLVRGRSTRNPHLFCVGFDYPGTEGFIQSLDRVARDVVEQLPSGLDS
jgi:cation diffusion facilitator CzcD-associated flavoprotein CzcO/phosphatidylglycerophosphate synthase